MKNLYVFLLALFAVTTVSARGLSSEREKKTVPQEQFTAYGYYEPDMQEDEGDKWKLQAQVLAYGGINVLETAPLAGIAVGMEVNFIRAEFDLGWTYLDTRLKRKNFVYFSPSVGLAIGKKVRGYLMAGLTTWGYVRTPEAGKCGNTKFLADELYGKLKAGADIKINRRLFVNVDIGYMFSKKAAVGYDDFDNLSFRAGVGYRF